MWDFMNIVKKVTNSLRQDGISGFLTKVKKHFYNEEKSEYYKWIKENTPSERELKEQAKYKFKYEPKISIVVPLYNTPKKYLLELIKYVQKQGQSALGALWPCFYKERICLYVRNGCHDTFSDSGPASDHYRA